MWKNHFVAIRAGVPSTYRLSNWCKDLEQTDITLNMLRTRTTNPKLSTYEAMEGMYSFGATPMAPIGTECMMHIKPTRRQTWGYHALKAWYFAPALNHYRCIKAVTDTGAVRLTDTFKFLHHTLPTPTVSNTDRIIKATQQLRLTIEGKRDAPADELGAIQHLRALITGAAHTPMVEEPDSVPEPEPATYTPGPTQECRPEPLPTHLVTQPTPSLPNTTAPQPHLIPFEEDEYEQPSPTRRTYNLRSRAVHVIQSAMTTTDNNTKPTGSLVHMVLDEDTGKTLEYRQLAKHPKYKEAWTTSYANELGRLTQGIRDIPGTNMMFFIPKEDIPPERQKDVTFGKIVTDLPPPKI